MPRECIRFCIIASSRTGSNFLCGLLNRVPGIVCHYEVFHPRRIFSRLGDEVRVTPEERDRDPVAFLAELEEQTERMPGTRAVGFKLFVDHNATVLEHVVADPDRRLIVLRRENLLAQYSSRLIATEAGRWHGQTGARADRPRVVFDEDDFRRSAAGVRADYERVSAMIEAAGKPCFSIDYLEIKDESALESLLEFLGVSFASRIEDLLSRMRMTKQNTSRIAERFVNGDDVVAAMRRLGHEEWLTDGVETEGRGVTRHVTP